jgi:hypothetical protein
MKATHQNAKSEFQNESGLFMPEPRPQQLYPSQAQSQPVRDTIQSTKIPRKLFVPIKPVNNEKKRQRFVNQIYQFVLNGFLLYSHHKIHKQTFKINFRFDNHRKIRNE